MTRLSLIEEIINNHKIIERASQDFGREDEMYWFWYKKTSFAIFRTQANDYVLRLYPTVSPESKIIPQIDDLPKTYGKDGPFIPIDSKDFNEFTDKATFKALFFEVKNAVSH